MQARGGPPRSGDPQLTPSVGAQGLYPVFRQADVKQAFSVACAVFQGRFLRTGESVLVRAVRSVLRGRGPCDRHVSAAGLHGGKGGQVWQGWQPVHQSSQLPVA